MMEEYFEKPHEECGVFGIVSKGNDNALASEAYNALFALQHRGQHSAGIAVSDGNIIRYRKADGLVQDVFTDKHLENLSGGHMVLGHVRYATKSGTSGVNAQPIVVQHTRGQIALAFNGKLTNESQLRAEAELQGGIFQTNGDVESMLYIIVREWLKTESIEQAVLQAMTHFVGAYSLLLMTEDKMIAVRDPHGFRPLCMGWLGDDIVFASESCALDAVGAVFERDVLPGEVIVADKERVNAYIGQKSKQSLCIFEYVYFARPDSVIDGVSVELARQEAGRCLAREDDIRPDVVIGVPDSGLSAALGYSQESGVPYGMGLVKNRYIGRTFIQETQGKRERAVKIKLNALSAVVEGKSVVMVDDSIVRGTTCARIVSILREAGAREVHMRVSSPPFLYPCYFGTDIPNRDVLIANNHTIDEIRDIIGVDSLRYLSLDSLPKMVEGLKIGFCDACFTGKYSVPVQEEEQKV